MTDQLRDRFFQLSTRDARDPEAVARFRADVEALGDVEPAATLEGLGVTWHPTARHKALRFVEADRLPEPVRDRFARPSADAPYLAAVFVDPRELSFRTFENIVPLDRLFDAGADVALGDRTKLAAGDVYAFPIVPTAAAATALERLDGLGLYVPPLNAGQRGGERFIFHSARLAEALTIAMKTAMPKSLLGGFSHVNPVFRCNRFEPGDANFHPHRDTPYFDAARHHVSKYTVLLYLTGGTGDGTLDIPGQVRLDSIGAWTCVIMDQRYEHEGAPFRDGRKVFLRTELIFEDRAVTHDPAIGALFAKACYWTGESVFEPELAAYADAYYNQVAAAHWHGLAEPTTTREPFVHKHFRGVDFVANGYDAWFVKLDTLSLEECAAIMLLDYFNCTIGGTPFRAACTTRVLSDRPRDPDWIPDFLAERAPVSGLARVDKSEWFPPAEAPNAMCCPFHAMLSFDATRHSEIIDLYTRAQSFVKAHVMPAPIVMLGAEVALDPDKFVIDGDRIHVVGKQLTPVNFAACWNAGGTPANYLDVEARVGVVNVMVPPILFHETRGCWHLSLDFFRNTWMVKSEQAVLPVPRIRGIEEMDDPDDLPEDEATPWFFAVPRELVRGGARSTLWWADDSPLVARLFSEVDLPDDDDDD